MGCVYNIAMTDSNTRERVEEEYERETFSAETTDAEGGHMTILTCASTNANTVSYN